MRESSSARCRRIEKKLSGACEKLALTGVEASGCAKGSIRLWVYAFGGQGKVHL